MVRTDSGYLAFLPTPCAGCQGAPISAGTLRERMEPAGQAIIERYRTTHDLGPSDEETVAVLQSFGAFVALADEKQRETGEPVRIYASY